MRLFRHISSVVLLLLAGFVSFCATALAAEDPAPTAEQVVAPIWGANVGLGMAFGGERPDSGGPDAGDGIVLTLGTTFTPAWIDRIGFGIGLDFGIKYAAGQSLDGGFELMRYPIVPTAHALVRIDGGYFLRVAAGPYFEVGITASRGLSKGEAEREQTFPSAVGALGEVGFLYTLGKAGAYVGVRYTTLSYETPRTTDASSWGVFLGICYFFL